MSTKPLVRAGTTSLTHAKVPWSHSVKLADLLSRAKEAQREGVRIAEENAEADEKMKMRDAKYRAYRKVMPLKVPSNNSDPLRQSPLTAEEITLCDELKRIALDMYYDERVCLLLAEKCREELCNKQATLITLQEVITRFIRMHPQRK